MIDIAKTIYYIRGALLEPNKTWDEYLTEQKSWQETAALITVPLIVASAILTYIFSLIFRTPFGIYTGTFSALVVGLIISLIAYMVFSFIIAWLAGYFKGENNFDNGLAAVSLAAVPAAVGSILGTIPWIGWIISLALSIYTLVLLYRNIPVFLKVPDESRVKHFISSIVAVFIVGIILSMIMAAFVGVEQYGVNGHEFNDFGGQMN